MLILITPHAAAPTTDATAPIAPLTTSRTAPSSSSRTAGDYPSNAPQLSTAPTASRTSPSTS
jgi:hypothetical protein